MTSRATPAKKMPSRRAHRDQALSPSKRGHHGEKRGYRAAHAVVRVRSRAAASRSCRNPGKAFADAFYRAQKLDARAFRYDKGLITEDFADRVLSAAHQLHGPVSESRRLPGYTRIAGARAIVCMKTEAGGCYVTRSLAE